MGSAPLSEKSSQPVSLHVVSVDSTITTQADSLEKAEESLSDRTEPLPENYQKHVADGGVKAWMALTGSFLMIFCGAGYVNSFGVYADYFVRQYLTNSSPSQISWIGSVQVLLLGSLGIPCGYAIDRGYFRTVMLSGSALLVFSLFMTSLTHEQQLWQVFLSQGIGLGAGAGMLYVPALAILTHHFKRRRSLALGISCAGSSIGGLVHPLLLNYFFRGEIGFRWGVRISAFFNLGLLLIGNAMMSTTLPPNPRGSFSKQIAYWKRSFSDKAFVMAVVSTFLLFSGVYFPPFFLQLASVQNGLSKDFAFYTISLLNGVAAIGRVAPTIVADQFGVFSLFVPCAIACGVLIFTWVALNNLAGIIVMAILYGFFSGAAMTLVAPMIASLTSEVTEIGARLGICCGLGAIGALIGLPISGALLTSELTWLRPVLFSGMCCVASGLTLVITKYLARWKWVS